MQFNHSKTRKIQLTNHFSSTQLSIPTGNLSEFWPSGPPVLKTHSLLQTLGWCIVWHFGSTSVKDKVSELFSMISFSFFLSLFFLFLSLRVEIWWDASKLNNHHHLLLQLKTNMTLFYILSGRSTHPGRFFLLPSLWYSNFLRFHHLPTLFPIWFLLSLQGTGESAHKTSL